MYKITEKVALNPTVTKMVIEAKSRSRWSAYRRCWCYKRNPRWQRGRYETGDALLHLLKAAHGLRHPQNDAGMPHRVHGHGGCGHDEAAPGADGKRDADGVPAAQHKRCTGFGHAGDQKPLFCTQ